MKTSIEEPFDYCNSKGISIAHRDKIYNDISALRLAGMKAESDGNIDDAISKYAEAIDVGEASEFDLLHAYRHAYERIIILLSRARAYTRETSYIERLLKHQLQSNDHARLCARLEKKKNKNQQLIGMKLLLVVFAALCLTACGGNEEFEQKPQITEEVQKLWSALSGTYSTTFYIMNTDNVWYTETITFKPFSEPKKILPPFTNEEGDVYALGEADIIDTRVSSITGTEHCYYTISVAYIGALPRISFYKYADANGAMWGGQDKRNIRLLSTSSFEMWSYGLSEAENVHTYTRQ